MKTKDLFQQLRPNARVLFVRLRSMGDCLLLTSPVRALKSEFPGFRISVLVETRFAGCFDGNPDFDEIIALPGKLSALRLLGRRFDAIINLHGGPTSLVYSCLAWGKRIGAEQYRLSWLYHGRIPLPEASAHSVEATMSGFQWLGVRQKSAPPLRYEAHPHEAARMRAAVRNLPYVVIHPGAVFATKRWDPVRFAEIARTLQAAGLVIVMTCGPGEESMLGRVTQEIATTTILLGLKIPELAELIRGAKLYLGNDSGPMHLAAAVETPTVAIWGSSDSRRWRPWQVAHRVVQNPFECNPCPGYRCLVADSPLCIESVTVEQVWSAVQELLKIEQSVTR